MTTGHRGFSGFHPSFLVPACHAANDLVITQPSVNETLFAEMRDFYVYGVFPNSPLAYPR